MDITLSDGTKVIVSSAIFQDLTVIGELQGKITYDSSLQQYRYATAEDTITFSDFPRKKQIQADFQDVDYDTKICYLKIGEDEFGDIVVHNDCSDPKAFSPSEEDLAKIRFAANQRNIRDHGVDLSGRHNYELWMRYNIPGFGVTEDSLSKVVTSGADIVVGTASIVESLGTGIGPFIVLGVGALVVGVIAVSALK